MKQSQIEAIQRFMFKIQIAINEGYRFSHFVDVYEQTPFNQFDNFLEIVLRHPTRRTKESVVFRFKYDVHELSRKEAGFSLVKTKEKRTEGMLISVSANVESCFSKVFMPNFNGRSW